MPWILILALASQGALPGVVMCVEPAGEVKVESIADNCCYGDTDTPDRTAVSLLSALPGSDSGGPCGPCTDTPISINPVTKPARNGKASVSALSGTTLAFSPAAIRTGSRPVSQFVTADAALIPIKTTTLLI